MDAEVFRLCSMCKGPIAFAEGYYRCSVSTCNRKRLWFSFCSIECWEAHRASERHRDAWAEPDQAPTKGEHDRERASQASAEPEPTKDAGDSPHAQTKPSREVLIVAAHLKAYVKAQSGMNISDRALPVLSDNLRELMEAAATAAARDSRKTILERDVTPLLWPARSTALDAGGAERGPRPDTLVVVSKLKAFVRTRSSMNTSDSVIDPLTEHVRRLTVEAIRNAARDSRQTVMDRDYVKLIG